ncbi:MAG: magnesium chelatase subunit D [Alphaproteobacteria bacterium]
MTEALTPWQRAVAALAVLAVDPAGVKGLWLRGRASPVRERVAAALPQSRRVHPSIDDTSLFGGVDLAATLAAGHLIRNAGLLATGAPVVLTMAERCPPGLSARLSRWLDDTGPCLIALDEGSEPEETLPSALADRLGLFLDLGDLPWFDTEAVALDPAQVARARELLSAVQLPEGAMNSLTSVAFAMGITSLRAPLLALAVARALAAWRGETTASDSTLRNAAELTLAHRGDLPQSADVAQEPPPPPPSEPREGEDNQPQNGEDLLPDEILLDAIRAALPAGLLEQLTAGRASRSAKGSGSGAVRKGNHRGRPMPSLPGTPGSGKRIDLVATLRAAAPWQLLRQRSDKPRLEIRKSDLRLKRYQESSDRVLIFAVDASGSSAFARLAEAKGAVELLLAQAYARRDHVALIAFRGLSAELILPPTRSLVQTKRRLTSLPGGGGTPLAAGLKMAFDLALQTRSRGMTPTVALLTDGRGNIALDGSANRDTAEVDSLRIARALRGARLPGLVIDTANRPQPALRRLAEILDAPYLPLPRADAQRLTAVLQAAMES